MVCIGWRSGTTFGSAWERRILGKMGTWEDGEWHTRDLGRETIGLDDTMNTIGSIARIAGLDHGDSK